MRLIVLGNYGPYPSAQGAVTGFLVCTATTNVVLDLGNGSLRNYIRHKEWHEMDAVILSHMHDDHTGDISVLHYVKRYEKDFHARLYVPEGPEWEGGSGFDCVRFDASSQITIGDMRITFCPVIHPVPTYAIKICAEGKTFVYSGDSAYTEKLIGFSANADLFLCEAGVLDEQAERKHIHMSVMEGCDIARRAHVTKAVFCHLLANVPLAAYQQEIDRNPDIDASLAVENQVCEI
jgi:ribonuclease BN (tRNA processing enzyme)